MIFPLYNVFDDNVFLQSPSILSAPRSTFTFYFIHFNIDVLGEAKMRMHASMRLLKSPSLNSRIVSLNVKG